MEPNLTIMQSIYANGYTIEFNEQGYEKLNQIICNKHYSSIFILTDSHSNENCSPLLLPLLTVTIPIEIIEIEPGENLKTIATCLELWTLLTEMGADRKSLLINLGGGVITDLGGFVAATFKRGIDCIHIPTTLLGMVDAAIGGKNGVDLGLLKNQVGVICNPEMVIIDPRYLETLPQREMRSGLAEMLKHGLIQDKNYWEQFLDLSQLDSSMLGHLIYRSIEIKNAIVLEDPSENGIRKALNFGHTIGHAIESHFLTTATPLLHGEAVAIGMIVEAYLSFEKGLLNKFDFQQIKYVISDIFEPVAISDNDIDLLLEYMIHDKKNEYGKIQFALLDGIGKVHLNQETDNEMISRAFQDYLSGNFFN